MGGRRPLSAPDDVYPEREVGVRNIAPRIVQAFVPAVELLVVGALEAGAGQAESLDEALPPPRQLAEKIRRVDWHPDVFYGRPRQLLGPETSSVGTDPETTIEAPPPSHEVAHLKEAAKAVPRRGLANVRTRLAARIAKLNE